VQRIARGEGGLAADGVTVQFNEVASGQTVFHLHFHVTRHEGVLLMPHSRAMEKPEVPAQRRENLQGADG
jgi:histidine triad (HIT) family protein